MVCPDRVIRQELFTNYEQPVKADLKKMIPGQLTRRDYIDLLKRHGNKIRDDEEKKELQDYQDLENLSRELHETNIKIVVRLFENLEEIPLSSRQLRSVLHSYGVNIRYLGRVTSQLTQHHIKGLCITEMIARSAKNIYNEQISKRVLNQDSSLHANSVSIWTVDFLNMLLGNSPDHYEFHELLVKQAAQYFKYSETELRQFDIRPTALYFAFLDLTNLIESGLQKAHKSQSFGHITGAELL